MLLNSKTLMLALGVILFIFPQTSPIIAATLVLSGVFGQTAVLDFINGVVGKVANKGEENGEGT